MESSDFYFHSNRAKPLFFVKEVPVYLATLLMVTHVVFLVTTANWFVQWMLMASLNKPDVMNGEVWRIFSYIFVHKADGWFIVEMLFLVIWGRELEMSFGRRAFGVLYLLNILIPAGVALIYASIFKIALPLFGTSIIHFCPFLAIAFCRPETPTILPALKLKWLAAAFFAIQCISYVQASHIAALWAFLAACLTTYFWLRKCGMSPRFEGLTAALKPNWPKRKPNQAFKVIDGGKSSNSKSSKKNPKKYYEPKIRPRAELDREHPAVREIDTLLEKISRLGIGSLTEEEKSALERASGELKDKDQRL